MTEHDHSAQRELFNALSKISGEKEMSNFLVDLCTMGEIEAMSQRYQVAKMLIGGEKFNEIQQATGASTATISRVNRAIKYGTGAYKSIIEQEENKNGN